MTYLLLQTFLLLLSAYFLGAFLACLAKRFMTRRAELAAVAAPRVSTVRVAKPLQETLAVKPRIIDPVQPKIDILPRPEPRPAPAQTALDTTRFDRALTGPDPNAGMPRRMIVEIRPSILKSPTGPAPPLKPKETPKPATAAAPAPSPAAVKPAPVQAVAQQPKPAQVTPVQPAPQPKPTPAPAASIAAPAAASASAGAAAATAAAAAAVAAAKAAAASVVAAPPKPAAPAAAQAAASAQVQAPIKVEVPTSKPAPAPAPAQTVKSAEPPRPAAPSAAAPTLVNVPPAKPVSVAPQPVTGLDDLQRIRAIDVDTERRLHGIGVRRFDDIARWTPADINRVNQALGLTGRIDREQWVEQAQILAKGGETYYSRNRAAAARGAVAAPAPGAAPAQANVTQAPAAAPQQAAASPGASKPVMSASQSAASAASVSAPQGKSVAEMASAAAAAIAAASASVTRGIRPIEPISPLSRANPNVSMPAKLSDAIKEKEVKVASVQTAEKAAAPAAQPSTTAAARAVEEGDDLKRIRGIGVLIEKRLNALNVTTYDQIANWTSGDIDRISQTLDFKGRIERENWVEQARILSSGGHTEFSRRVDRGDVESSKEPDET